MPHPRLPDWQLRLEAFIGSRWLMPFAWGTNDCAIFAADAVLAVCGYDPAEGLRGHRTAQDAQVIAEEQGGVVALARARLGARIGPLLAAAGDVGMVHMPVGPTLVVCAGGHFVGPGERGVVYVATDTVRLAWRCD